MDTQELFERDDFVEFEVAAGTNVEPRGYGRSGYNPPHFLYGRVFCVYTTECLVGISFGFNNVVYRWGWELPGHEDYKPDCWTKPGYLRHTDPEKQARLLALTNNTAKTCNSTTFKTCTCDIVQLLNTGHVSDCPERRK